ncbi:MAG: SocA family protein [Duncaniella sp.]|nr:SocA family protein [Duncaniella sp.]
MKIVYIIDEHFVTERGFPLTWFNYQAWEKGPVAPEVYDVKNGAFSDFVTVSRDKDGSRLINSVLPNEFLVYKKMDDFSTAEISEIDKLLAKYKDMSADELTEITHAPASLWSRVVERNDIHFGDDCHKTELPVDLRELFGEGDYRMEIFDEAQWNMEFQKRLNQN